MAERDNSPLARASALDRATSRFDRAADAFSDLAERWIDEAAPITVETLLGFARHHREKAITMRARAGALRMQAAEDMDPEGVNPAA